MARRGDEPQAEALDVVIGVVERVDFQLASIAGSGIDLADRQAAAEPSPRGLAERRGELRHGGVIGRRRPLGERPAKYAFEKQLCASCGCPYRSWPE